MTLDELASEWAFDLNHLGPPNKRYFKLVVSKSEYPVCFVGKGRTVQQALDNALKEVNDWNDNLQSKNNSNGKES